MSNEGFVAVAHIISRQVVSRDRWLAARNTEERAREVGVGTVRFFWWFYGAFLKWWVSPTNPWVFLLFLGNHHFFWKHPVQAYTGS